MGKDRILELRDKLDFQRLPGHVAIIMDGNGRWARDRSLPRSAGHQEGMRRVVDIVEAANAIGIKYLSLYAFSTENWKRPKKEIDILMNILILYIKNELGKIHKNNIKIRVMGDIGPLPRLPRVEVKKAIEKTRANSGMVLNIGLNYGGRNEIVRGVKDIVRDVKLGKVDEDDIDVDLIARYLYTGDMPDPDLLIRPSGEIRVSNFMLYQIAYTEFWFSNIYWPDFTEEYLYAAIIDYQNRDRRFGGL
ncbi:MAG: isoprenyl transferase [Tissierellia bacterium]|nr:isoprenyl transferase [Tissierellia bacterium]